MRVDATDPVTAVLKKMGCTVIRTVPGERLDRSIQRPRIEVTESPALKDLEAVALYRREDGVLYSAPFHGCDVEWVSKHGSH